MAPFRKDRPPKRAWDRKTRMFEILSNEELASIAGHPVTISVGSAFWEPGSGCSIDETLRIADRQMYIDKARESPE